MNIVTATKSNNTITVLVNDNGEIKPIPATSEHPKWTEIVKAWTEQNYEALLELLSLKRIVEKFSNGDLVVSDNGVFYKDVPLVGIDVNRIMAFLRTGDPYQPIANYMARKLKNPSKRAINEMYNFLEHKQMPLTPNGTILAYKGVQKDFYSVSSGKEVLLQGKRNEAGQIFNGIGETIEMNRSDVDDDFRRGCSGGLHAGSLEYAKDWARQHNGVIILIEIDPPDVVSVPEECQCKKLRCCKYKVLGLYNGPLPDTYTDEFSTEPETDCPTCGEPPLDCTSECDNCGNRRGSCTCNDEICSECGYPFDECDCNQHGPNCDCTADDPECGQPECNGNLTVKNQEEECPCPTCVSQEAPGAPMPGTCYPGNPECEALGHQVTEPRPKETARELLDLDDKGNEIRQKFVALICEFTGCSPNDVTDDKTLVDLGFDSLDGVEFVMALEEDFNREISDEESGRFENSGTVGEMIAALTAALIPISTELKVNPMYTMSKNLDSVLAQQELVADENTMKVAEQNEQSGDTYQKGYELGFRQGVRHRKRLYREENENDEYGQGYCAGYHAGRKDYKH